MPTTLEEFVGLGQQLVSAFGEKETEKNWAQLDDLMKDMRQLLQSADSSLANRQAFHEASWRLQVPIAAALHTERTKLAVSSIDLVAAMASILRDRFETLYDVYFGLVLKLCERTNKVISGRAHMVAVKIVQDDPYVGVKYYFAKVKDGLTSASKNLRLAAVEMLQSLCQARGSSFWDDLEEELLCSVAGALSDAQPSVRTVARSIFSSLSPAQKEKISLTVPTSVLKALGMATGARTAAEGLHPQSSGKPQGSANIKAFLLQQQSKKEALAMDPTAINIEVHFSPKPDDVPKPLTLSNQSSYSRLPVAGPAKRHVQEQERAHSAPSSALSKTAKRVLKGVFELTKKEHYIDDPPLRPVWSRPEASKSGGIPTLRKAQMSGGSQMPPLVDLQLKRDWSQKAEYLDAVTDSRPQWQRTLQVQAKLQDLCIAALNDVHFRVLEAGLRLATEIIPHFHVATAMQHAVATDGFIADVVVRGQLAAINNKGRKQLVDSHCELFKTVHAILGPGTWCQLLASVLSRLDVLGLARLRIGLFKAAEDTVKWISVSSAMPKLELAVALRTLTCRAASGLADSDSLLSSSARCLILVIVAALGRPVFEETVLPSVKGHAEKTLLLQVLGSLPVNNPPSLIPRSPVTRFINLRDDDEVLIKDTISLTSILNTPVRHRPSLVVDTKGGDDEDVEALAMQLSMTPIK